MKKLVVALAIFTLSISSLAQIDRTKVPVAQPNPEIKIEIPEPLKYANGLNVILVENHKLPKVSFQLFIDYTLEQEGEKAGLSEIFGQMIGSGTLNTPKDQFDEKIDFMGATLYTNPRGFFASSLKKHTPQLMDLLFEVVTQPGFTQEDFDRIKAMSESNLASIPSDASSISTNVENVVNYGSAHPYGEIMTEKTLNAISLDDVKRFYTNKFNPNKAYLIVVGDIKQDELKQYMAQYFEKWEKGADQHTIRYEVPNLKGNQVYFVDKPGAVQSVIKITHNVNLTPGHEDEIKLSVLNSILGGGSFSARLMSNLREDKAYTYGCYSRISSDPIIGNFSASGSFRNDVTDSAIVQILAEINEIAANQVTDKELDLVKKSMTGAFARSLESPETIARFALNTVRYNLSPNYYANYLMQLEKITKEELLMVAAQYLSPENLNIIVVGNEAIAEKLSVFDKDGEITYKNYYGEDQQQLKEVEVGVTAESIFNTYAMHYLGTSSKAEMQAKIASINMIEIYTEAVIKAYGATLIRYSATGKPNKSAEFVLIKTAMGNQSQKEWFNGEKGEQLLLMKMEPMQGEELESAKLPKFPLPQLNYLENKTKTVQLLGVATIDGLDYYKIKIAQADKPANFSFEFYSVKTGMLALTESFVDVEGVEPTSATISYKDYAKTPSGLFLPKQTEINAQGQVLSFEFKKSIVSKKANMKVFNGDFKKIEKAMEKM